MNAQGLFLVAGGVALAGNTKKTDGFPANGYATVGATVALTFLAALVKGSKFDPPLRGLAVLALVVSVWYYVPILVPNEQKRKANG